jgi:hypothetical protein
MLCLLLGNTEGTSSVKHSDTSSKLGRSIRAVDVPRVELNAFNQLMSDLGCSQESNCLHFINASLVSCLSGGEALVCDNATGSITQLRLKDLLPPFALSGTISSAITLLTSLTHLYAKWLFFLSDDDRDDGDASEHWTVYN